MTTIYDALSALQIAVSGSIGGLIMNYKETVTIGGTVTPVDVLTITLTSGQLC